MRRREMKAISRWTALAAVLCAAAAGSWSCRGGGEAEAGAITVEELERHVRYLSDDRLEGRGLGSRGLELAAAYQEDYFRTFGLEPAFADGYRQAFDLRGARPDPAASLEFLSNGASLAPVPFDDFVIGSEREDVPAEVTGGLVYAGFLVQAPERDWNDVKGADLRGKVLLCEINEPGNAPGGIFDGEEMTYHGRWTAKFERAGALGAAGVLIVHNDKGAAYGWPVIRNSWSFERFFLPDKERPLLFQGWIDGDTAAAVFAAAGLDRQDLLARAERPDFTPVPLPLTARVRQRPAFRTIQGVNVAGIVRARHPQAKKRTIVVSAHYDHLGTDEALAGDRIYNGAVDNCAATAAFLAFAADCAARARELKSDLLFAAVTAEEQNLLGSEYLARHLPVPLEAVLANVNFEMTNVWGETQDVFAIGARYSDMDGICAAAAASLGLTYTPERNAELGFFYRSDQLSFVKAGIPGVWLHQGIVSRGPDPGLGRRKFADYQRTKYHQVGDEIQPDWDFRGSLQIIDWAREIVRHLGELEDLPGFRPDSPFRRQETGVSAATREAPKLSGRRGLC